MSSLSLTAYKALARGAKTSSYEDYPDRPEGTLIWGVVHDDASARALLYLAERLSQLRGPCKVLLTYTEKAPQCILPKGVFCHALPSDMTEPSRRFLDHWQPDYGLWFGGDLRPTLIAEAKSRDLSLALLSGELNLLDQPIWRWMPSLARETLDGFEKITALDEDARRLLRRMDAGRRDVEIIGHLQDAATPPATNESVFEEVSNDLNGRPVWLAAQVQEREIKDILAAHRASIKVTHRLALILIAADFPVSVEARTELKKQGWRVCHWEDGDTIEEHTQVILVEEPEDMGLWYRIAPLSFLASSLRAGFGGCDPYPAASLGSAIIYGPNIGPFVHHYSRLAAAGAARIVKDAHGLASAISHLLAADQAASMAHAAWVTISEGAEATDAVIDDIQLHLDEMEGGI